MARITCTRRLQFCAGHRVYLHESKCANLHGHNYVVFIEARADQLDAIGRVIDFSVLKERYGRWIEEYWDHGFIYNAADQFCDNIFRGKPDNKYFLFDRNPTAENMAWFLLKLGPELMSDTGITITKVTIYETENCSAEVSL